MRHTDSLAKRAGIALSLRLFPSLRCGVLWPLGVLVTAINTAAQTAMPSTPAGLLTTDPRAFAEWVEAARPAPVSARHRERILASLPPEGEVTPDEAARQKIAALDQLLRATGRDSVYVVKVVDTQLARTGIYERTVLLISEGVLRRIGGEDLKALIAHEIAHEYVWTERERASRLRDYRRLKELELLCDAIAIVILHGLGIDPSRLIATVEKLTNYNLRLSGVIVNASEYPTLAERLEFARAVNMWVARASPRGSSR